MNRIQWIDIARCFAIVAVYIGHYGVITGNIHSFIFSFHVPLFFFLSGCTENLSKELPFVKYAIKKAKQLLIPALFFIIINQFISLLQGGSFDSFIHNITLSACTGAIRNSIYAGDMWFLTCLFVVQILFYFIRLVKYKWLMLIISFGLLLWVEIISSIKPLITPSWYWNVDSAMFYIFFYALGFVTYPWITELFKFDTTKKKTLFGIFFAFSSIYSIALLGGKDLFAFMTNSPFFILQLYYAIILTGIIILFFILLSKLLEDLKLCGNIGTNSLYLYGSENAIKTIVTQFAAIFGILIQPTNPLGIVLLSIFIIWLTNKYIVPVEKRFIGWINDKLQPK